MTGANRANRDDPGRRVKPVTVDSSANVDTRARRDCLDNRAREDVMVTSDR